VHLDPTILITKQIKRGGHFRGGISSFGQVQRDVPKLIGDASAAIITTMFDLYKLPNDFPGMNDAGGRKGRARAEHLEAALNNHFAHPRFVAFLMVHEFEGMAFADPAVTARILQSPHEAAALQEERNAFVTAEDVNDGEQTHPSKRIMARFPYYKKPLFGPAIVQAIGLTRIREECPHFAAWLSLLESL
jgi:hypothetical protein